MYSLPCFYLASFYIGILLIHVSGKAKVGDLHFSSFSYKHVSCCEVPVYKLIAQKMVIEQSVQAFCTHDVYEHQVQLQLYPIQTLQPVSYSLISSIYISDNVTT